MALPGDLAIARPRKFQAANGFLGVTAFTTGLAGLVIEYILATTASYILGDSIVQWSVTIAVMMLFMGIGGFVQKSFSDIGLVDKFAMFEMVLALTGAFAPLINYAVFGYEPGMYPVASAGLAATIGLLVGLEIPLAMRINAQYTDSLKTNAAHIIGLDYVGSFVGAILWVKYFLPRFPLTEIPFLISGFNFAVAIATVGFFWRKGMLRNRWLIVSMMAATVVALAYGYTNNRSWSLSLQQKFYEDRVIYTETSKYQHLTITEDLTTGNIELYINGNKQFSSLDEIIYHEMLIHPAMSLAHAQNVLILGGGDGMALREVLKYRDVKEVTLVDLDPAMTRLAKTHPVLRKLNKGSFDDSRVVQLTDGSVSAAEFTAKIRMETKKIDVNTGRKITEKVAHVQVMNIDAGKYLDSAKGSFDVIVVDLPDPNGPELVKLYSQEVFTKIRSRLSQNGVLVVQATSPYHAKDSYLSIGMTMRAAGIATIPYHQNVPSFGEWGWFLGVRANERLEANIRRRITALDNFEVETSYINPETFRASLVFPKGWLDSKKAAVNTIADPVLFELYTHDAWRVE